MLLTCTECGNVFESGSTYKRLTCSDKCKRERFARVIRWNAKLRKQEIAEETEKPKPKPRKRKNNQDLIDKTVEAREKGLTYGQLVALETAKTVKVVRKW